MVLKFSTSIAEAASIGKEYATIQTRNFNAELQQEDKTRRIVRRNEKICFFPYESYNSTILSRLVDISSLTQTRNLMSLS